MWFITRAASNTIYPTCTEKGVLTSPDYLIKFVCVSTKDIRYCWASDTSDYPTRYQELTFTETTTPTSGTAQVKLDTAGSWDYYIYEYTGTALVQLQSILFRLLGLYLCIRKYNNPNFRLDRKSTRLNSSHSE